MILQLKVWKRNCYASSYANNNFLSTSYTPLYIYEHVSTFVHTMNYLVVKQHYQNIQIHSHNILLKQILASAGVNVPLNIPNIPNIESLTIISTT